MSSITIPELHEGGLLTIPPADPNRWYLCVEEPNMRMTWSCQETTKDGALSYIGEARSMAIPISRWSPKFADKHLIHSALTPKVRIVQEFKKTNS